MKRLDSNVSTAQRSLEKRPEILHAIHMHPAFNVSLSLIDYIVNEAPLHPVVIGDGVICVDGGAILHVLENLILQSLAGYVRHNRGTNLAEVPVKNSLHNRLACRGSRKAFLSCEAQTARTVHVPNLPANKSFVRFQFATFAADLGLIEGLLFHNFADSLEHEPCRRLRHSQSAAKFVRTDSVLRIRKQPKRCHPLIKADGRIFHYRLDLDRELALAGIAEPQLTRLDKRVLVHVATRTHHVAVRPAQFLGKLKGAVWIGKVDDSLLQRFRLWNVLCGVQAENDTTRTHVCHLVYCPGKETGVDPNLRLANPAVPRTRAAFESFTP